MLLSNDTLISRIRIIRTMMKRPRLLRSLRTDIDLILHPLRDDNTDIPKRHLHTPAGLIAALDA